MSDPRLSMIASLLTEKGNGQYGLADVRQVQHALQAAWLAERDGQPASLIAASLMHDIGHMVHDLGEDPAAAGIDDRHEELGQVWLATMFGPEVTEPVRLHVAAKRYLCAAEPDYFAKLSPDSVRSLQLQGGKMSAAEMRDFESNPHAQHAVQLRRYDEAAKVKDLATPPVAHFMPYVRACILAQS